MEPHSRPSPLLTTLKNLAGENLGLKVTSLLIALAVFGLVRGAGNVQRSVEVSLLARLPPASARRVLVTDLPTKIRLTVRGSPSLVAGLRPDELDAVQIDLSDGRRPSYYFDSSLFELPAGVQVVQIQPASLQLDWENLIERNVPVRPQVTGAAGPGLRVSGALEVIPPIVRVTGPELFVASLGGVGTDAIELVGLSEGPHEIRVALDPPRPQVRYSVGDVRVAFTIDREIVERTFERLQVTPLGTARVELRPPVVSITLRGEPSVVNALDAAQLVPTVDVGDGTVARPAGRVAGTTHAPVSLSHLPASTSLVRIEPTEVIVVPTR